MFSWRRAITLTVAVVTALALTALPAVAAPAQPQPPVVTAGTTSSLTLDWPSSSGASRYEVLYSKNYSMSNATSRKTSGKSSKLTVTGLSKGTYYCFQVRGLSGSSKSRGSQRHCKPTLAVPERSTGSSLVTSAQTFNICAHACPNWSGRKPIAVGLIKRANTDIVGLQETYGASSIVSSLPGYAVAADSDLEMLLYRTSRFSKVRGGTITMATGATAAWAELRSASTNTSYMFISAHPKGGKGASLDRERKREVNTLISKVNGLNTAKVPVVYLGDYNSNRTHDLSGEDGPRIAFEAAGYADAYERSSHYTNPNLNSFNGMVNPPKRSVRYGDHVDRIFIRNTSSSTTNTTADDWKVVADISGGKYSTPFASDHNPVRATLQLPKPAGTPRAPAGSLVRLGGKDRYETAVKISQNAFAQGARAVYVAAGSRFPDGLASGPAASRRESPTLLVPNGTLPSAVKAEITRLNPTEIFVVGGAQAVSAGVESQLQGLATTVTRVSGADRYATAAGLAQQFGTAATVYLASGSAFPDALSGGAAAARDGAPLLLTKPTSLPSVTRGVLKKLGASRVVLVGGPAAVSSSVSHAVDAIPGVVVTRVGGADRYDTSAKLMSSGGSTLMLASGANFPDALTGVPASVAKSAAFALTRSTCVPKSVIAKFGSTIGELIVLGGTGAIGGAVSTTTCTS